jgi:hypothetical protein
MHDTTSNAPRPQRTVAALSLSALLLFAVLVVTAVNPWTPLAKAEMSVKENSYAAMTTRAGPEELLWVIDDRGEALMVYAVAANNREVRLVERQDLADLFRTAKAAAGG